MNVRTEKKNEKCAEMSVYKLIGLFFGINYYRFVKVNYERVNETVHY